MNIEMVPLEMIGLKTDLQTILHVLRRLGCVHIDEVVESPEVLARPLTLDRETLQTQEDMSFLLVRLEGLLDALGCTPHPKHVPIAHDHLALALCLSVISSSSSSSLSNSSINRLPSSFRLTFARRLS